MTPELQSILARIKMCDVVSRALSAGESGFRLVDTRRVTDGRDIVRIETPFLYPDGDLMTIYMERPPGETTGWRLTDAADTIAQQKFLRGLDGNLSPVQDKRFREVLDEYAAWVEDVGLDDNELHMTVAEHQVGFGIAHFAQLQIRLSAICMFDS